MKSISLSIIFIGYLFGTVDAINTKPCKYDQKLLCFSNQKDKVNTTVLEFFPNGNLAKEISYSGGKKHGKYFEYYENGDIKIEIDFVYNKATKGVKYSDRGKKTKMTHAHFYNMKFNY